MIYAVTLLASIALGLAAAALYRVLPPARSPVARYGLAGIAIAVAIGHHAYWLRRANFDWAQSLPLHFCDLATLLAPASLLWPRLRTLRAVAIGWGLALTPLAFVAPVVDPDAGPWRVFFYLASHGVVVSAAVFHVATDRGRFPPADLLRAIAFTWLYGLATAGFNAATGFSYGYTGRAADPAWLDRLGPWPWRLGAMALLSGLLLAAAAAGLAGLRRLRPARRA
ncbi:MAG: YwaF family protein [Planctomycetota bacterium]